MGKNSEPKCKKQPFITPVNGNNTYMKQQKSEKGDNIK